MAGTPGAPKAIVEGASLSGAFPNPNMRHRPTRFAGNGGWRNSRGCNPRGPAHPKPFGPGGAELSWILPCDPFQGRRLGPGGLSGFHPAALQQASGGIWGGYVFDVERIVALLEVGRRNEVRTS